MPEVQLVIDAFDYSRMEAKKRPNINNSSFVLMADCDNCGLAMGEGSKSVLGEANFLWGLRKGGNSADGYFETVKKDLPWLFQNIDQYQRPDSFCVCSKECVAAYEGYFQRSQRRKRRRAGEESAGGAKTPAAGGAAGAAPNCEQCGAPDASKRCSQCKSAMYCSRECQRDAWKTHSKECMPSAEPPPAAKPTERKAASPVQKAKAAPKHAEMGSTSPSGGGGILLCSGCQKHLPGDEFTSGQKKKKAKRRCKNCVGDDAH